MLNKIKQSEVIRFFGVFAVFFVTFFFLYFSINTLAGGDDQFFHFRFAYEMRQNGFFDSFHNFKSLYFSKMAQGDQYFLYYNFLFFVLIIPFTFITPLFLGIKLYGAVASALVFTALYYYLRRIRVNYAFWWSMLTVSSISTGALFRFFTSRPFVLALALLLALLLALHKKKYWLVTLISFVYFFWHSSTFFFTSCVAISYAVFEGFYGKNIDWRNLLWSTFGTTLAIGFCYFIGSDFLGFIYDTIFGIYRETILGQAVNIPEGQELYKIDLFDYVRSSPVFITTLVISVFVFITDYINTKGKQISMFAPGDREFVGTIFFLTIGFFLGNVAVSARFGDFLVSFGAVFVALIISGVINRIKFTDIRVEKSVVLGVFVAIIYMFFASVFSVQNIIAGGASVESMRPVGEWINNNIPKKSVIYNASWNWFPQLYYHAPDYYYIAGLEPRFLYVYSHELYFKWKSINDNGYVCAEDGCPSKLSQSKLMNNKKLKDKWYALEGEEVADTIIHDFNSHYVVVSKLANKDLVDLMDHSDRFTKELETESQYLIYGVLDKYENKSN